MLLPYDHPDQLVTKLKEYIIGQDHILKAVALYLFKHAIQLEYELLLENKSVLLLTGQTGTGKTFIIKKAAELLNFHLIVINAKDISQEGWKGESLEAQVKKEILSRKLTQKDHIIVFIDEFDKMCMSLASEDSIDYNMHIQYSILKYLDQSSDAYINASTSWVKHRQICFILGGNFEEMRRQRVDKMIGFNYTKSEDDRDICKELMTFGMIPEIAGRVSEIVELNSITKEAYEYVWNNKNFFLNLWKELLETKGIMIDNQVYMDRSVSRALKKDVGIRGLIQEANLVLNEVLLNNPSFFRQYTLESIQKLSDLTRQEVK